MLPETFLPGEVAGVDGAGRLTRSYSKSAAFVLVGPSAGQSDISDNQPDIALVKLASPLVTRARPGDFVVASRAFDGTDAIAAVPVSRQDAAVADLANAVARVLSSTDAETLVVSWNLCVRGAMLVAPEAPGR